MLGKILPFVLIGFIPMAIILLAAWLLFGVPTESSVALLVALTTFPANG